MIRYALLFVLFAGLCAGQMPCVGNSGSVSLIDVQSIVSLALGGPCVHSVTLSWTASTTAGVTYNVYRGPTPGGPYTKLASKITGTTYVDVSVSAGQVWYYVTTAVNSDGESTYSNEAKAAIPTP